MKRSLGSKIFDSFNVVLMLIVIVITLYPFLYVASVSLSSQDAVVSNMVTFYPIGFNLEAYERVLSDSRIWNSYGNTFKYVTFGTFVSLLLTSLLAYALSRRALSWRRAFSLAIVFTMLFNGGLIPLYMVVRSLGMIDTIWAIVLPGAISAWNLLVMRTFFEGIPESLTESAFLDGATEMQSFIYIVVPLSGPIFMTMGLFYAVDLWNSFFGPFIFLNTPDKYPLQIILRNIVIAGQTAMQGENPEELRDIIVSQSIITATIMVASLPIICVYPFIQKYFVKGVLIGAIKG